MIVKGKTAGQDPAGTVAGVLSADVKILTNQKERGS